MNLSTITDLKDLRNDPNYTDFIDFIQNMRTDSMIPMKYLIKLDKLLFSDISLDIIKQFVSDVTLLYKLTMTFYNIFYDFDKISLIIKLLLYVIKIADLKDLKDGLYYSFNFDDSYSYITKYIIEKIYEYDDEYWTEHVSRDGKKYLREVRNINYLNILLKDPYINVFYKFGYKDSINLISVTKLFIYNLEINNQKSLNQKSLDQKSLDKLTDKLNVLSEFQELYSLKTLI